MFGEDNFEKSTTDFLSSLINKKHTFYKYKCLNIESPIDLLYHRLQTDIEEHNMLSQQLKIMSQQ